MAGLFIEFLVEKCAACQSGKSDFGWHRFCFSPCWMRKRFRPYLIAFRSCISKYGKPELSLYRAFSHDVTAAILVFQNNETAAMLLYQQNRLGVERFSHVNAFFCSNKLA